MGGLIGVGVSVEGHACFSPGGLSFQIKSVCIF